jgi:hypothetical protein
MVHACYSPDVEDLGFAFLTRLTSFGLHTGEYVRSLSDSATSFVLIEKKRKLLSKV